MKIRALTFDDEQNPETVTAELTIEEAAYLAKLTGQQTGITANQIMPGGDEPSHEIYDCLISNVFNTFYEDGVNDYLRSRK